MALGRACNTGGSVGSQIPFGAEAARAVQKAASEWPAPTPGSTPEPTHPAGARPKQLRGMLFVEQTTQG